MYFMVDANGAIMSVNPFGAEQLGFTVAELIGLPVRNLFHAEDREAVERNAAICFERRGPTTSWEARKIRKNGEVLWVRETARVMVIKDRPVALIVCEDITEQKRVSETLREMQTELAHANRVATMGQLTASIAHEVNQPIAAAVTNAHAALRWLSGRIREKILPVIPLFHHTSVFAQATETNQFSAKIRERRGAISAC